MKCYISIQPKCWQKVIPLAMSNVSLEVPLDMAIELQITKPSSGRSRTTYVMVPNLPNFLTVSWYNSSAYFSFNSSSGEFDNESSDLPGGYKRANSFKNYKSSGGHPKGLFYEVNLYTFDGASHHHTSCVSGSIYSRKSEHDQSHGKTKGRHWRE